MINCLATTGHEGATAPGDLFSGPVNIKWAEGACGLVSYQGHTDSSTYMAKRECRYGWVAMRLEESHPTPSTVTVQ